MGWTRSRTHFTLLRSASTHRNPTRPTIAGALTWKGARHEWTAVCNGRLDVLQAAAAEAGVRIVAQRVPSLDEIFVAQVGKKCAVSEGE